MRIDLSKKFPKDIFNIIKLAGDAADKKGFCVYIVGGPVRDALLSLSNNDLDIVVEGDGIRFAGILNKKLNGRLNRYMAFKTATIRYKEARIDIASTRSETYEKPAAYPKVSPGTIKDDLFRRDFTINAMAISINKGSFGQLIDLYGGVKDLKKGIIKVMHERSFVDDPTRIFRAVRFSVRFDFKIEARTKRLMRESVLEGYMGRVNRGRIKKELELLLKEKHPRKCLEAFSKLA